VSTTWHYLENYLEKMKQISTRKAYETAKKGFISHKEMGMNTGYKKIDHRSVQTASTYKKEKCCNQFLLRTKLRKLRTTQSDKVQFSQIRTLAQTPLGWLSAGCRN